MCRLCGLHLWSEIQSTAEDAVAEMDGTQQLTEASSDMKKRNERF
jgi:hypothetical protein